VNGLFNKYIQLEDDAAETWLPILPNVGSRAQLEFTPIIVIDGILGYKFSKKTGY